MGIKYQGKEYLGPKVEHIISDNDPGPGWRRVVRIAARGTGQGGAISEPQLEVEVPGWANPNMRPSWDPFGPAPISHILNSGDKVTLNNGETAEGT